MDVQIFVLPSESCSLLKCSGALRNLCQVRRQFRRFCWHRIRPELLPEVIPILAGSELRTRTCSLRSFFQRLEATLPPEATPRSLESFQTKNQICLGAETDHLIFHFTTPEEKTKLHCVLHWFTRTGMVKRELEDAAFEQESDCGNPSWTACRTCRYVPRGPLSFPCPIQPTLPANA